MKPDTQTIHNLIIIGSGPAGLTAAVYASLAFIKPLVIEGDKPGGQLMNTTLIENWPGHKSILGPELMMLKRNHAEHFGAVFISGSVASVDFSERPFKIITNKNRHFLTHSVIIATGASPNILRCPGESDYWGKGLSTCAICDGAFYPDKQIVIVGGGDTAMEQALFMSRYTQKITIVHIQSKFTASPVMQQRVLEKPFIKVIYSSTVTALEGDGTAVKKVTITHQETNQVSELPTDVVFLAIGQKPNTSPFQGQLELDKYGYIVLKNQTHTSIPGVFVAGDVADYRYKQAIVSAGSGCMAALDAQSYLEKEGLL